MRKRLRTRDAEGEMEALEGPVVDTMVNYNKRAKLNGKVMAAVCRSVRHGTCGMTSSIGSLEHCLRVDGREAFIRYGYMNVGRADDKHKEFLD